MNRDQLIARLNDAAVDIRLAGLRQLRKKIDAGEIEAIRAEELVNNHIHTIYSFSPYSPAKAVWMAYQAGLATAGIIDHDSVSGALEFIEAGDIMGLATTIGFEIRVDFSDTPLKGRRINNPDQDTVVYVTIHGIPHDKIAVVKNFLIPYSRARNERNRLMVEKLNGILRPFEIRLSFEKDVVPLSLANEGGSITERHILFALVRMLVSRYNKGSRLVAFCEHDLDLTIPDALKNLLLDENNPFYEYDLLGLLKGGLVPRFYIDATTECPSVAAMVAFTGEIGAIISYAYLGDIGSSVTGDKRAQKFEDDFLDELFVMLDAIGFKAVSYMPTRNTLEQLHRVKSLCTKYNFLEICGEDINHPRQSFTCEALRRPEFRNLIDSTWALIGHEISATRNAAEGFFSEKIEKTYKSLDEKIKYFMKIGKGGR